MQAIKSMEVSREMVNVTHMMDELRSNVRIEEQYAVFKSLRTVTQNLFLPDDKYRTLYTDNGLIKQRILAHKGGMDFLKGIGFQQGVVDNELVCQYVDGQHVQQVIDALNAELARLKRSRHEWDPKFKKESPGLPKMSSDDVTKVPSMEIVSISPKMIADDIEAQQVPVTETDQRDEVEKTDDVIVALWEETVNVAQ